MTLFDRYVLVDWSANARPKRGKDSIWFSSLPAVGEPDLVENAATRGHAETRATRPDMPLTMVQPWSVNRLPTRSAASRSAAVVACA